MKKILLLIFLACTFLFPAFAHTDFAPPTTAASNIIFFFTEGNSFRINWTNGNGSRRIVVMRQGSAVTALPVNGTDYNENAVFGNGDAIQSGQFVVYDNTGNFVDVSGLQPN